MPRTARRRLSLVLAAATLTTLTAAGTARAADEATDAPVTRDDVVTVKPSLFASYGVVDVLANDYDPTGDQLAICRVDVPEDAPIRVTRASEDGEYGLEPLLASGPRGDRRHDTDGGVLLVEPTAPRDVTATFTYYACDHDFLTPATVTVTVDVDPPVRGRKVEGKPGKVRFTNPGDRPVLVLWGGPREDEPDGRVRVPAHEGRTVRVQRHLIVFVAVHRRSGEPVTIGRVRGIRLPGDRPAFDRDRDHRPRDVRAWRRAGA